MIDLENFSILNLEFHEKKKRESTHKYFIPNESQQKLCSFKIIFPILQFVVKDDGILDHKLLVELGCDGSDRFLAMAVAVIDQSIGEKHGVVTMAGTTTFALYHEVTAEVDGPTV